MSTAPQVKRAWSRLERPKQTAWLRLRCFPEELETMRQRAKEAGKTLSSFVRDSVLAPNPRQSDANSNEIQVLEESLSGQNHFEDKRKLLARHLLAKNGGGSAPQKVASGDAVSDRTGHSVGCACFACSRLRTLLAEDETQVKRKTSPK